MLEVRLKSIFTAKVIFINVLENKTKVSPGSSVTTSFESHESVLLEYPYKTNCRDYSKIGFTSQKHCKEMCFKSKTIQRYKALLEDSHGFPSDNISLMQSEYPWTNQSTVRYFKSLCKKDCEERDCRSVTYHIQDVVWSHGNNIRDRCLEATRNESLCPPVSDYTEYSEQSFCPA